MMHNDDRTAILIVGAFIYDIRTLWGHTRWGSARGRHLVTLFKTHPFVDIDILNVLQSW